MNNENGHIDPQELLIKYFANEASEEERLKIEKWKDITPQNKKEFEAFDKLWNISGKVSENPDINIDSEWQYMEQAIKKDNIRKINFKRILQIAASLVLLSAFALSLYINSITNVEKTGIAQVVSKKLPDGSKITLNATSKITYKKGFGDEHRDIKLKGEAYFEVEANPSLPFKITTGDAVVEVVGTKFNVSNYKEDKGIKVVVTEGKVKFYKINEPDQEVFISAGESAILLTKNQEIEKDGVQDINEVAWITRKVDFYNTQLYDVARILNKTYHRDFIVNPEIKDCTVTVKFEDLELDMVLEVLKETLDLKITRDKDKVLIEGEKCSE